MITDCRFHSSRFELKYVISEALASSVKAFLMSYLRADRFTTDALGYPVHSLYFDAPRLMLYRDTLEGKKNRFKLRIRYYDDAPDSPAFLEIKRRADDAIIKNRAAISRAGVNQLLAGDRPDIGHLLSKTAKSIDVMKQFHELRDRMDARPQTFVCYHREAFVSSDDDHLRVTFDRKLYGAPYREESGLIAPSDGAHTSIRGVVLELKFSQRFPKWMRDLVQVFHLQRCSVPKYVECTDAIGRHSRNGKAAGRAHGLRREILP